jgi:hypothetical protein
VGFAKALVSLSVGCTAGRGRGISTGGGDFVGPATNSMANDVVAIFGVAMEEELTRPIGEEGH